MSARDHSSDKSLASNLPGLSVDARARVQEAEVHASEVLLQNSRAACQDFLEATEELPKAAAVRHARRTANALSRSLCGAEIRAGRTLVDAVATEYGTIDTDSEVYSERLMLVVLPFVLKKLETGRNNDHLIKAAIETAVMEWETRRKTSTQLPATLTRQSPAEVIDRLRRKKGWTIEVLAEHASTDPKVIYRIKRCKPVMSGALARVAAALGCQPGDLMPVAYSFKSQR
jgi:DNA-binding Xre family transcriptional regulator